MSEPFDKKCDIRIGTSGYDYPEWEGKFYPCGLGRTEYLGSYSESFRTLELNFHPQGLPDTAALRAMMAKTRRPIDFSVMASRVLTHGEQPAGWRAAAAEFIAGIEPLAEAGRLCAVLIGFPPSFLYRDDERRYHDGLLKAFVSFPLVVEFLNAEWYNARVIEGFKTRGVGLCLVDVPRLDGLPPVSDMVTADLAYVRFHGRDRQAWLADKQGEDSAYPYSRDELAAWVPRLQAMCVEAERLRVYFTNHRAGAAPAAARELARLIANPC